MQMSHLQMDASFKSGVTVRNVGSWLHTTSGNEHASGEHSLRGRLLERGLLLRRIGLLLERERLALLVALVSVRSMAEFASSPSASTDDGLENMDVHVGWLVICSPRVAWLVALNVSPDARLRKFARGGCLDSSS